MARARAGPGTDRLRHHFAPDAPRTRTDLEDAFLPICEAAGVPRPRVNAKVLGWEVDFTWSEQRLAIETDGRDAHLTRSAFEEDRRRDAALTAAGWRVVRFTWRQVSQEPRYVARMLGRLLITPP